MPDDMSVLGAVGAPYVYIELCLEDVPDMGYNPLAEPQRGEICLKGDSVFSGYYKNPQLTRESIIDGWFHTGYVGKMLPNGDVEILERKKYLIKLLQGQYVALEYLEKIYDASSVVENIWVYGDSLKSIRSTL